MDEATSYALSYVKECVLVRWLACVSIWKCKFKNSHASLQCYSQTSASSCTLVPSTLSRVQLCSLHTTESLF